MDNESNLIFEQYKMLNEMSGLNRMMGKMVNVPGPGSQNAAPKVVIMKLGDRDDSSDCEDAEKEEETVYIQAGDEDGCSSDCGCHDDEDDHYDGELDMARSELLKAAEYATKLFNHMENLENLEGWTASKITKAADYLSSVYHSLEYDKLDADVEDEQDPEDDDLELDVDDMTKTAKETGFGA
tara:strand:+ start:338 stop:886 length:549 start_codon:yes stop_codon:yes gene_type:complete